MASHPNITSRKKPPDKGENQETDLPDQVKTFASTAKSSLKKNVPINWVAEEALPEVKCRWYRIRDCSQKVVSTLKKKFKKTLSVCYFEHYKVQGYNVSLLCLGFNVGLGDQSDFESSKVLNLPNGKKLHALCDDELENGILTRPTPEKTLYLDNVPLNLFRQSTQLRSALAEYVDIFDVNWLRWGSESKCYNGKVAIRVKKFKKLILGNIRVDFNGSSLLLGAKCYGVDRNTKTELEVVRGQVKCFTCSQNHLAKNCPVRERRKFKWKCSECLHDCFGCFENHCKMQKLGTLVDKVPGDLSAEARKRRVSLKIQLKDFTHLRASGSDRLLDCLEMRERAIGSASCFEEAKAAFNKVLEIECRHLINSNQEVMNSSSCG